MAALVLLGVAVGAVVAGGRRLRAVGVALCVAAGLGTGIVDPAVPGPALRVLVEPLAFLAAAVPLAVLLDRVGFFDAAAGRVVVGHRIRPALWVFAAAVTTVFNLDAAIVLLTPLYLRIADRHGLDPVATAFQPVLLASLASSALPVSNLTNMIVAEHLDLSAAAFVVRLGPVSLAATTVGWFAYRRLHVERTTPVVPTTAPPADPRAWRYGLPAVGALLLGFTAGDVVGVAPWLVALAVTAALAAATRSFPWRALPVEAAVVAGGLAVLAAAAAPALGLGGVLAGTGPVADARAFVLGVVGADLINNLPALLVALPHLEGGVAWAYLAGVNLGPALWLTGSVAGLLWADILRHHGHPVSALAYARTGVRVGLPALGAALVVLVLISAVAER